MSYLPELPKKTYMYTKTKKETKGKKIPLRPISTTTTTTKNQSLETTEFHLPEVPKRTNLRQEPNLKRRWQILLQRPRRACGSPTKDCSETRLAILRWKKKGNNASVPDLSLSEPTIASTPICTITTETVRKYSTTDAPTQTSPTDCLGLSFITKGPSWPRCRWEVVRDYNEPPEIAPLQTDRPQSGLDITVTTSACISSTKARNFPHPHPFLQRRCQKHTLSSSFSSDHPLKASHRSSEEKIERFDKFLKLIGTKSAWLIRNSIHEPSLS